MSTSANDQLTTTKPTGANSRWVIKIGSSLVTQQKTTADAYSGVRHDQLARLCDEILYLRSNNIDVVLVSSGAVGEGAARLGLTSRPTSDQMLRAAAAVGQMGLVQHYESLFLQHNIRCAQLLLTHEDLSQRKRYLNAQSTIKTLLSLGVLPIVNENDSIVIESIRFGDNDQLAGLVTNLIEADRLVILTDQDGMYTADPAQDSKAQKIDTVMVDHPKLLEMAGGVGVSGLGSGGMYTKVLAARLAARSGAKTHIISGHVIDGLQKIQREEPIGTLFLPAESSMPARKRWLAGHMQTKGQIVLDEGAVVSLTRKGASLLAVGVCEVRGEFARGDVVRCIDIHGQKQAIGLVNYSSQEIQKIKGNSAHKIPMILGYESDASVIHRDNLVVLSIE